MSKGKNKLTRHHIVPRSRGGGRISGRHNVVMVRRNDHRLYHELFNNKTPQEILQHLVEEFWGGQWQFVVEALEKQNDQKKKKKEAR